MNTNTLHPFRFVILSGAVLGAVSSAAPVAAAGRVTGFDQAAKIAQARVPDGQVRSVELKVHLRRELYEVELDTPDGCEHEVLVAADDGSIVREKRDCD